MAGASGQLVLVARHLAGNVRFETISDWYTGVKRAELSGFRLDV